MSIWLYPCEARIVPEGSRLVSCFPNLKELHVGTRMEWTDEFNDALQGLEGLKLT
jgi:hypothetical protein